MRLVVTCIEFFSSKICIYDNIKEKKMLEVFYL